MSTESWQDTSVSLSRLRQLAEQPGWGVAHPAFEFLHEVGVVPETVKTASPAKVRININREAIPAGYLASVAYEWDTWGPSHPLDFVEALEAELDPSKREFISTLLTTLGRSVR